MFKSLDDETSTPVFNATKVDPNPKCMGCLNYDNTRSFCLVATFPTQCGDGSTPKTGFSPIVSSVVPASSGKDDNVQVLGDEGYIALSEADSAFREEDPSGLKKSLSLTKAASGTHGGYLISPRRKGGQTLTYRAKGSNTVQTVGVYPTDRQNIGAAVLHSKKVAKGAFRQYQPMSTAESTHMKNIIADARARSASGASKPTGNQTVSHRAGAKPAAPSQNPVKPKRSFLQRVSGAVRAAAAEFKRSMSCPKCKEAMDVRGRLWKCGCGYSKAMKSPKLMLDVKKASLKNVVAYSSKKVAKKYGGPSIAKASDRAWAIATAAWSKVAPEKRKPFTADAMARHEAIGEHVNPNKYARRAPREFMEHIMVKSGSFVSEFGPDAAAEMMRCWSELQKATPSLMAQVRQKQMENHHPDVNKIARKHGGGKVFSHEALATAVKVKPDVLAKMAHGCAHAHDFVKQFRATHKDKAKHLTDGQLKSAYHSTGLMHSMSKENTMSKKLAKGETPLLEGDLDLIKAHVGKKRSIIGHTSSGKPVHSDSKGGEAFNREEHEEACEMHQELASRLGDVAWGYGGYSRGKLPPTAMKYVKGMAEHHTKLASKHRNTANHLRSKEPNNGYPVMAEQPEMFTKKSIDVSDEGIAKAMMEGGGAGSITEGGVARFPLNVSPREDIRNGRVLGLPITGVKVELHEAPAPKKEREPEKQQPTVGGVAGADHLGRYVS